MTDTSSNSDSEFGTTHDLISIEFFTTPMTRVISFGTLIAESERIGTLHDVKRSSHYLTL